MKRLKRIGKIVLKIFLVGLITLFIFELSYRYQWVDFYASEWRYHNEKNTDEQDNSILVFGDSFSADPNGWVYMLRDSLGEQREVFNAAIPGVGPETHAFIFNRKKEQAKPKHIIVQMYVGNDQYDYNKPVNWSKQSFFRNIFWSLSNRFRVLNFLNYRIGQSSVEDNVANPKEEDVFNSATYSPRTKLYIQGAENYPANLILLEEDGIRGISASLIHMRDNCGEKCKFSVLLIPHCTQVSANYVNDYKKLGSKIEDTVVGKSYWNKNLTTLGLDVLDPLPYFIELEEQGEQLYYANDPHLNATGNAWLTSFVIKELTK